MRTQKKTRSKKVQIDPRSGMEQTVDQRRLMLDIQRNAIYKLLWKMNEIESWGRFEKVFRSTCRLLSMVISKKLLFINLAMRLALWLFVFFTFLLVKHSQTMPSGQCFPAETGFTFHICMLTFIQIKFFSQLKSLRKFVCAKLVGEKKVFWFRLSHVSC